MELRLTVCAAELYLIKLARSMRSSLLRVVLLTMLIFKLSLDIQRLSKMAQIIPEAARRAARSAKIFKGFPKVIIRVYYTLNHVKLCFAS
jgi:hypothetical protein